MDKKLLNQFKRWAKSLLRVNPDYVKIGKRLRDYIRGPNWDAPDVEYAHYREYIEIYGEELLKFFEDFRNDEDASRALANYNALLTASGVLTEEKKTYAAKALKRAEAIGVYEYNVNGRFMEYWSFFGSEGWYFVRHDLDKGEDVFRGANIPFGEDSPIPAFLLTKTGATLYNYMVG